MEIMRLHEGTMVTMMVIGVPKAKRAQRALRAVSEMGSMFIMDADDIARVGEVDLLRLNRWGEDYRRLLLGECAAKLGDKLSASSVARINDSAYAFIFDDDDRLVEARLRYG